MKMPTPNEIIREVEVAIDDFNKTIPKSQGEIFDEIQNLTKQLVTKNGRIVASGENIRLLSKIRGKIERVMLTPQYKESVKDYLKSFDKIATLQNQYFESVVKDYKQPRVLEALRQESINSTLESLTETGLRESLVKPVRDILRTNIASGAKYSDLVKQLRNSMLDTETGAGLLTKHVKTLTTNALNIYARENINTITNDLELDWHSYNGSIIETSRDICKALNAKKFFHRSEIPKILKGDFKEFRDIDGKINPNTGLPYGMIDGTTVDNFLTNLGGNGCRHMAPPVHESVVPQSAKDLIKSNA